MRERERKAISRRIDKGIAAADARGKSATAADAERRDRDAERRAVASERTRTTVVAVETRTIDGVDYVVSKLDNPVGDRMAARSALGYGRARQSGKRDITRGAGSSRSKLRKS